jgi:hypothetical protein
MKKKNKTVTNVDVAVTEFKTPERRVFFVDVGNMSPQQAKTYLASIKNELKNNVNSSKIQTLFNYPTN